jgi:uncharacterized protein (DUF2267 family)
MTTVPEFRQHIEESEAWVTDLQARLGWEHTPVAYQALLGTLHALRDVLGDDDALYLALALPTILRGSVLAGWHPRRHRRRTDRQAFLTQIHEGVHRNPGIDPEHVARKVLELLADRLPPAELEQVKATTPPGLLALWPD